MADLRFDPTDVTSDAYDPLLEVRRGPNEVRDVQDVSDILVDLIPFATQERGGPDQARFHQHHHKHSCGGVFARAVYSSRYGRTSFPGPKETRVTGDGPGGREVYLGIQVNCSLSDS